MVTLSVDDRDIGNTVKQLRIRADISRVELGAASGVSTSHLTRIENGQRFPSAKILRKIAPHLHIAEGIAREQMRTRGNDFHEPIAN